MTRRTTAPRARPASAPTTSASGNPGSLFPGFNDLLDPRGPFLVPLLLLVIARVVAWAALPLAAEDAFITFRYARNLAAGNGLVYNPGEKVMGFTSMPWALWSTLGILTVKNPVLWARATNLIADAITLLVMGQLMRRHVGVATAASFTTFFAGLAYFAAVSASGMESSVFLMWIVLAAALLERRHITAGAALAMVAWTRPEGLAAAAVLALIASWRDRLVAAVLLAVAWAGTWAFYGTIVPQSLLTKAQVYGNQGPWIGRHWWEWLSPAPTGRWPTVGDTNLLVVITVVSAPALVVGLRELVRIWKTGLAAAIGAALVVWLGYAILGVTYFWWYLAVPLGGIAAAAAVGLPRIVRGAGIYIALALWLIGGWSVARHLYLGRMTGEFAFVRVAQFLEVNSQPGESVLLEPIGVIGFSVPLRVIDEVGLVSPKVAERRLGGPGWYHDVVVSESPDWLVLRAFVARTGAGFAGAGMLFRNKVERDSLFARYVRAYPEPGKEPGDQDLVVLRRVR
jgi:arabinofuranosyltransferase